MQSASWKVLITAFLLGVVQVFAFAPFHFWPLVFVSLVGLFLITRNLSPRAAFVSGLAFGYGLYGVGVSWVYVSLSTYGGMPLWMGSIAVLGFAGLLAFFIAMACYVVARCFTKKMKLFAWPFVWLIFEWMKSWVLTGFPWLDLGYSQTPTWLLGWAPIGGIYLVSFIILVISSLLATLLPRRQLLPIFGLIIAVVASWLVDRLSWSQADGAPIQVAIVQANVPINEKWQVANRDKVIGNYMALSHRIQSEQKADLIIWPETALPVYLQQTDASFWQNITPGNTALLTGVMDSPVPTQEGGPRDSYNAAALSCGGATQVYRKRHLVPFGEYLPLRFLFNWVLVYLDLPMSDFSSWQGQQNLVCGDLNLGLSICYEDAFANEYRQHVGAATLLVNISEDAWFGDSFAPHQRAQMAQMRARELARPLVRSANSGPSLFIDERGKLLEATPQFEVHTLSRLVQPHTGDTPYKRFGNWVIYLSFLVLATALTVARKS